jgi:5'-deoxynucleotidase YfbR-like HD superfamily hydrolase
MSGAKQWINTIKEIGCVVRFSQAHLSKTENVLEHLGFTALIALHISERLRDEGHQLDQAMIVKAALIHDLEESMVGDVSRPTKYHSQEMRQSFAELESDIALVIFNRAECPGFYHHWVNAKEGPEGKIMKFVDLLAVLTKVHDESVLRGNKSLMVIVRSALYDGVNVSLSDLWRLFPESRVIGEYSDHCEEMINELKGLK